MNLLASHIEQIFQSSIAISELPFSTAHPFTTALLRTNDITNLIRDTESHERALFSLANLPSSQADGYASSSSGTRKSIFQGGVGTSTGAGINYGTSKGSGNSKFHGYSGSGPGSVAVGRILGRDLLARIQRADGQEGGSSGTIRAGSRAGEVDVCALLDGAERLCAVYPVAGAGVRIAALRRRYEGLVRSVERYGYIVEGQARELEKVNRGGDGDSVGESLFLEVDVCAAAGFTRDDLRREEREIKELEQRRKLLEQRVHGMERDLGSLTK